MNKFKMNEWTRMSGTTTRLVDDITNLILKSIADLRPFSDNKQSVIKKIVSLKILVVTHTNIRAQQEEIMRQIYENLLIEGHSDLVEIIKDSPQVIKFMGESYHAESVLASKSYRIREGLTYNHIFNDLGQYRPSMEELFRKASTLASYGIINIHRMSLEDDRGDGNPGGLYFSFIDPNIVAVINMFLESNWYEYRIERVIEAPFNEDYSLVNDIFTFLLKGYEFSHDLPDTTDKAYGRDYISIITIPDMNISKNVGVFESFSYLGKLSAGDYIIRGVRHCPDFKTDSRYKLSLENFKGRSYAIIDAKNDVFRIKNVNLIKELEVDGHVN